MKSCDDVRRGIILKCCRGSGWKASVRFWSNIISIGVQYYRDFRLLSTYSITITFTCIFRYHPKKAVSQNGLVPKRPCVDQSGNLLVCNGFHYWFAHGRHGTRSFWERPFRHVTVLFPVTSAESDDDSLKVILSPANPK